MANTDHRTATHRRIRKSIATAAAVAAAAGTIFAATPANAATDAYPTSSFAITYGASYYNGTVTWYNRSATVSGTLKATGCRRVYGQAFAGAAEKAYKSSSTQCDSTTPQTLILPADVPGGADTVYIWMTDGTGKALGTERECHPTDSVCAVVTL